MNPALNKIKDIDLLNQSLAEINANVIEVNATVTNIYDDTQYIRTNMVTDENFRNNMTFINTKLDDIDTNLSVLMNYCSNTQTNSSALCTLLHGINNQVTDTNNYLQTTIKNELDEINSTTHSTYDYVTGTLATNVNSILSIVTNTQTTVNQINTTVNTIDTNINYMQDNVTEILENQQAEVDLRILS